MKVILPSTLSAFFQANPTRKVQSVSSVLQITGQFRELLRVVNSHTQSLERMEDNFGELLEVLRQMQTVLTSLQVLSAAETQVPAAASIALIQRAGASDEKIEIDYERYSIRSWRRLAAHRKKLFSVIFRCHSRWKRYSIL